MPLFNRNSLKTITQMWNVVFVMGFKSLSMTARGMELGQAAHRFFSRLYLVAMTLSSEWPKTEDEKCAHSNMRMFVHVCLCLLMNPTF